jgi:hypothetical protein
MSAMTGHLSDRYPPPRCSSIPAIATASTRGSIWLAIPGFFRADVYGGFNSLYDPQRSPGPITEAACWSHGRRKFFVLADITKSAPGSEQRAPLAVAAVRRIDAIFAIEGEINGLPAEQRLAVRAIRIAPLVAELESWMRSERARLPRHADVAKAMDYMLKRWAVFTRFLADGRICLSNNAAERALRGIAIGRKKLALRRLRSRRRAGCRDVYADRHRQAQQCRSAGLGRRPAAPDCRPPGSTAARAAALELAKAGDSRVCLQRERQARNFVERLSIRLGEPEIRGQRMPWFKGVSEAYAVVPGSRLIRGKPAV